MTAAVLDDKTLRAAFGRGVYFHAVGGPLTHNAGCLAEGLMDLGIPVRLSASEFTSRPISMPFAGVDTAALVSEPFANFAAYVVDISHTNAVTPFTGVDPGKLIYLNQSDIATFGEVPPGVQMFAAHENRFVGKGPARQPLAFGMSKGLVAATATPPPFSQRKREALRNFRPTLNQDLRALLDLAYVPRLETRLPVDRTIHPPGAYLRSTLGAAVCLAYGGSLYSPLMDNPWFRSHDPQLAAAHHFQRLEAGALVLRWDSWRLWESFASGCVTVHLDFEKYGFALPVMPTAWEHYVPIDLDAIAASADALIDRADEWEKIAAQGRAWALAHYTPIATARYVLSHVLRQTAGA